MATQAYILSIEIILPKRVVEGETFDVEYRFQNKSQVLFPGEPL